MIQSNPLEIVKPNVKNKRSHNFSYMSIYIFKTTDIFGNLGFAVLSTNWNVLTNLASKVTEVKSQDVHKYLFIRNLFLSNGDI